MRYISTATLNEFISILLGHVVLPVVDPVRKVVVISHPRVPGGSPVV